MDTSSGSNTAPTIQIIDNIIMIESAESYFDAFYHSTRYWSEREVLGVAYPYSIMTSSVIEKEKFREIDHLVEFLSNRFETAIVDAEVYKLNLPHHSIPPFSTVDKKSTKDLYILSVGDNLDETLVVQDEFGGTVSSVKLSNRSLCYVPSLLLKRNTISISQKKPNESRASILFFFYGRTPYEKQLLYRSKTLILNNGVHISTIAVRNIPSNPSIDLIILPSEETFERLGNE